MTSPPTPRLTRFHPLDRCLHGGVGLTAVDLLRICQSLVVEPADVAALVAAGDQREPAPAPLLIDDSGERHALVLRGASGRCPFLLRMRDGSPVCGLGALAPAACWTQDLPPDQADVDLHDEVVAAWNAYACRWPRTAGLGLDDVGRYLLDATAVLAADRAGSADVPARP